jgi:hypothetical protein
MKTPIEMIAEEHKKNREIRGFTPEHDDQHESGSMAMAAALYASPSDDLAKVIESEDGQMYFCDAWPWDKAWDKRKKHDMMRRLQIAGALIVAEMERLQRREARLISEASGADCGFI